MSGLLKRRRPGPILGGFQVPSRPARMLEDGLVEQFERRPVTMNSRLPRCRVFDDMRFVITRLAREGCRARCGVRGSTLSESDVARLVESSARIPSAAGGKKGTYPCHETGAPQPKRRYSYFRRRSTVRPHLMRCGRGAASYLSFTASRQQPTLPPKIDLHHQLKPTCHLYPSLRRRHPRTISKTVTLLRFPSSHSWH